VDNFAGLVSRALRTVAAANRDLYVHGPEPITLAEPLQLHCAIVAPGTRLVSFRAPCCGFG
jgi:hypothetical protein